MPCMPQGRWISVDYVASELLVVNVFAAKANDLPVFVGERVLNQALATWNSDELTFTLNFVGDVTDDNKKDDLFGEYGDDYLHFGRGDKQKN